MSEFPETMISVTEIDEPDLPIRAAMDDEKLESLIASIRELGIVEPLILEQREDRYRVAAGHRRLLAARRVGLVKVPAKVYPTDHPHLEAIKVHENVEREELNPAEEGIFYQQLVDKFKYTEEQMIAVVKQSADYIAQRLRLTRGDPAVLRALLERKITLGVAEELNRMKRAEDREYYLSYSEANGAGVKLVREWRHKANLAAEQQEIPVGPGSVGAGSSEGRDSPPAPTPTFYGVAKPYELSQSREEVECRFCGVKDEDWRMFKVRVCPGCANRIFADSGGRP